MNHFIQHGKCTLASSGLLILDDHGSHVSYEGLELAHQTGITMDTFPANASHEDTTSDHPVRRELNHIQTTNDSCVICGEIGRDEELWFRCT